VVISSTANFAKGVLVKPNTLHICYCHTPPRFLYHYPTEVNRRKIRYLAPLLSIMDNYFRIWDYSAAQRVDYFIANSNNTAKRIEKFYRRNSEVIYPPVRSRIVSFGASSIPKDYFLIVSRLAKYKRIDLAIEACNRLHKRLVIIGAGRDESRLRKIAGETIEFKGNLSDEESSDYYKDCQAFLFPGEDDFGITPVEAMGMGKPVIALGKGGALETVIPGKTGEFFREESVESLMQIMTSFNPSKYDQIICKKQAEKFSEKIFKQKIQEFVDSKWNHFQKGEKESEGYARTT
jgi:glycosyltransferase involved in cell wall biosynthesis